MRLKHTISFLLIIGFFMPIVTHASIVYLDPASVKYGPGDTFILTVRINNEKQCINAAEVTVSYPPASLRAEDFSRGSSIFSLWPVEPKIDTEKGTVTFAGGVPGGYCGVLQGDPGESNALGKIVFTVLQTKAKSATVSVDPASMVYLNDGLGTEAPLKTKDATVSLLPKAIGTSDVWVKEVKSDTIPPDAFNVDLESTQEVFGGQYYIVFSTVDKQSGIDHYEIYESGVWRKVASPYLLPDQSLKTDIQVKAIDKAGNETMGIYTSAVVPPSQVPVNPYDSLLWSVIAFAALLVGIGAFYVLRGKYRALRPHADHDAPTV